MLIDSKSGNILWPIPCRMEENVICLRFTLKQPDHREYIAYGSGEKLLWPSVSDYVRRLKK